MYINQNQPVTKRNLIAGGVLAVLACVLNSNPVFAAPASGSCRLLSGTCSPDWIDWPPYKSLNLRYSKATQGDRDVKISYKVRLKGETKEYDGTLAAPFICANSAKNILTKEADRCKRTNDGNHIEARISFECVKSGCLNIRAHVEP